MKKKPHKTAELFKDLKIRKEQTPLKPLSKGKFPSKEEIPIAKEIKTLSPDEEHPGRGGKIGGKIASSSISSQPLSQNSFRH